MKPSDFSIDTEFSIAGGRFRVTDIGTRTVIAIKISEVHTNLGLLDGSKAQQDGWFNGPPYAVAETVFDENDLTAEITIHD